MLKVADNNISFNKGETVCLELSVYTGDGVPLILPPINNNTGCIALTVKSGISGDIVLVKYLDTTKIQPVYNGQIDYSSNGFNKFSTQEILEFNSLEEMYAAYGITTSGNFSEIRRKVAHCTSELGSFYYCYITTKTGGAMTVYDFTIQIPIFSNETQHLDAKEYTYDICAYLGELKDSLNDSEFPFKRVDWKLQIMPPHSLILEDSNNV